MSIRTKRVGEEIQKVVSEQLIRGLREPVPGFVTIKDVEVTSDFTHAKIFYSVIGTDADKRGAQAALEACRGELRYEVGKRIRLRNTPNLSFVFDDSGERAARVHALLAISRRSAKPKAANPSTRATGKKRGDGERKLFGTDGIRGVANVHPMTAEMALRLGRALAYHVRSRPHRSAQAGHRPHRHRQGHAALRLHARAGARLAASARWASTSARRPAADAGHRVHHARRCAPTPASS